MNEQIFRKKSMERLSSPEQLNDYIKVTNPGAWMILFAIIALLAGVCIWGVFGRMESRLTAPAISKGGMTLCYVKEDDAADVKAGMTATIDNNEYLISGVSSSPIQLTDDFDTYALHIGSLETGEWVYEIYIDETLPDGVYKAEIVTESISPMSFLMN